MGETQTNQDKIRYERAEREISDVRRRKKRKGIVKGKEKERWEIFIPLSETNFWAKQKTIFLNGVPQCN